MSCHLLRLSPALFGMQILSMLPLIDIVVMDVAVSDSILREWWTASGAIDQNQHSARPDACLSYLSRTLTLIIRSDAQIKWLLNRSIISSHLIVDCNKITDPVSLSTFLTSITNKITLTALTLHVNLMSVNLIRSRTIVGSFLPEHLHRLQVLNISTTQSDAHPDFCNFILGNQPLIITTTSP